VPGKVDNRREDKANIPKGTATKAEYVAVGVVEDSLSFLFAEADFDKGRAKKESGVAECKLPLDSGFESINRLMSKVPETTKQHTSDERRQQTKRKTLLYT